MPKRRGADVSERARSWEPMKSEKHLEEKVWGVFNWIYS